MHALEDPKAPQAVLPTPELKTPSPADALPRLAFSAEETATILGLSITTVRRLMRKGRLKTVRGIRHKVVPRTEIDRFLRV